MANVLAELFANTADAIREKTGDTGTMKPAEFPEKIRAIETGGGGGGVANIIPLTITENGKYNVADGVDGYAPVTVNVENKIPEGYIKPTGTVQITENGTVDVSAYANAEVSVPTGGSGEVKLESLTVEENGEYRPTKNFNPLSDWAYLMKSSYTQEYLSALYTKASVLGTFPLNEFTTAALLIDNPDGIALMALCFSLNGYTFYGLMKECSEPKFWVSAEVANALGQGSEGWYTPLDATGMNFAPSDTPKYPWVASATATISIEEISMLFVYDDFDAYDSVSVDVKPKLAPLTVTSNGMYVPSESDKIDGYSSVLVEIGGSVGNIVRKSGSYKATSTTDPITITHNLGVTPDIIIVRMSGNMESPVFKMMTFLDVLSLSDDLAADGAKQFYHWFMSDNSTYINTATSSASIFAATTETSSAITAANANTFTVGSKAFRHIANSNYSYSWEVIGGITS